VLPEAGGVAVMAGDGVVAPPSFMAVDVCGAVSVGAEVARGCSAVVFMCEVVNCAAAVVSAVAVVRPIYPEHAAKPLDGHSLVAALSYVRQRPAAL
jgi:hypothetical protein